MFWILKKKRNKEANKQLNHKWKNIYLVNNNNFRLLCNIHHIMPIFIVTVQLHCL